MPGTTAFRALRFSPEAGPLAELVAPPYDVLGAEDRERLGSKNPCNVVNLTLPEGDADPGRPGNRYERAGAIISEWRSNGVLVEDAEPALTVVREEFDHNGQTRHRTGVQAAVRLNRRGEGDVLPHERTLSGPRADRLVLTHATGVNLSPVFLLVSDRDGEIRAALADIASREPDHDVRAPTFGATAERTRVWLEHGEEMIERVEKAMAGRPAVIADGHHRYETALAYRDEVMSAEEEGASARSGSDPAGSVLCHMVPIEDEGLVVLPYHRMVKPRDASLAAGLLAALGERFALREVTREEAVHYSRSAPVDGEHQGFILATGNPAKLFRAELSDKNAMRDRAPERTEEWRGLDVSCLHTLVIEDILGITPEEVAGGGYVTYSRDIEEVIGVVESGHSIGLVLRPTPAEAVLAVARAGDLMPQKSTCFYPKVAAGYVMRSLR